MPTSAAGTTVTLTAQYQDGTGTAVAPVTPLVAILNPLGIEVLTGQIPTYAGSTGRYSFNYDIPIAGPLGSWTIVWSGIINGAGVESSEVFAVVEAGDIIFPGDILESAPCHTWPVRTDCMGLPDGVDPDLIDRWAAVATQVLWALSGRRWGTCPVIIRPCRKSCLNDLIVNWSGGIGRWIPYISDGIWRNASVCGCQGNCSCSELCEVYLPGPVASITEVLIDGAVLDPNDYRLDAGGSLVRLNSDCWPICQHMDRPGTADGTFQVTYEIGLALNEAAIAAVSELTGELVKNCIPDLECKLPRRVTQINRAGMVAQFIDPQTFLKDGRTGLYLVDLWLSTVNPKALPNASRVMSPDHRPPRQMTT